MIHHQAPVPDPRLAARPFSLSAPANLLVMAIPAARQWRNANRRA
jgi:hypothetical protein